MEAASTGTATRKPAWMGVREICLEMKGASGPNITQVVNPVSKYRKQASKAFQLPLRSDTIKRLIGLSLCNARVAIPKKNAAARAGSRESRSARVGSVALLTQQ